MIELLEKADQPPEPTPHYDQDAEQNRLLDILERGYRAMLRAVNALVVSHFNLDLDEFRVDDNTTRRILQQAAARVVRIDETTRAAIAQLLQQGQERGYSNWQLAYGEPKDNFPGINGLFRETWKNRAMTVARTELQQAQRDSALERYHATGLVDRVRIIDGCEWDAVCCDRDGKIVPIEQAPDLAHPNCLVGGQIVWAADRQAGSARWYEGEIVILRTAAKDLLSVTPDHPILTSAGWRLAGQLRQGDHVIRSSEPERMIARVAKDSYHGPAKIEQVACPSGPPGDCTRAATPMATDQLDRDALEGDIDVEWSDSQLLDDVVSTLSKPVSHRVLLRAGVEHLDHARIGTGCQDLWGIGLTTSQGMRDRSHTLTLFGGQACGTELGGFTPRPRVPTTPPPSLRQVAHNQTTLRSEGHGRFPSKVAIEESLIEGVVDQLLPLSIAANVPTEPVKGLTQGFRIAASDGRNLLERLTGFVESSRLVEISRRQFAGNVYNLQTAHGWYVAERIVTHNCTLVLVPVMRQGVVPGQ